MGWWGGAADPRRGGALATRLWWASIPFAYVHRPRSMSDMHTTVWPSCIRNGLGACSHITAERSLSNERAGTTNRPDGNADRFQRASATYQQVYPDHTGRRCKALFSGDVAAWRAVISRRRIHACFRLGKFGGLNPIGRASIWHSHPINIPWPVNFKSLAPAHLVRRRIRPQARALQPVRCRLRPSQVPVRLKRQMGLVVQLRHHRFSGRLGAQLNFMSRAMTCVT